MSEEDKATMMIFKEATNTYEKLILFLFQAFKSTNERLSELEKE